MNNKIENIIGVIYGTLISLGFLAADAGMIYWAWWNEDFIETMFTIAWVLVTMALNLNVWHKIIKRALD